jgi:hypothetical protein
MRKQEAGQTWLAFVLDYMAMKWPGAAAKSRYSMVDALATVTVALVHDVAGRPGTADLRAALRDLLKPAAFRERTTTPVRVSALQWLERASVPLSEVVQPGVLRAALDALALTLDGKPAAAITARRRRSVFYSALQYAVDWS